MKWGGRAEGGRGSGGRAVTTQTNSDRQPTNASSVLVGATDGNNNADGKGKASSNSDDGKGKASSNSDDADRDKASDDADKQ